MLDFEKAMNKLMVIFCIISIAGAVGWIANVMETYPTKLIGDANGDGKVDACDASYVMSYYSDMSTASAEDQESFQIDYSIADVNHDGLVDVCDASEILAYYSDLMTSNEPPSWVSETIE